MKTIKGIIGLEFIISVFIFFTIFSLIIINFLFIQTNIYKNFNSEADLLLISAHIQNIILLINKLSLNFNETILLLNNLGIKYELKNIKSNNSNSVISNSLFNYNNIVIKRIISINGKMYKLTVFK
ncbi:MAG: hypothetical protein ACP5UN_00910 [Candidatus Micrarchaeia archaeon]